MVAFKAIVNLPNKIGVTAKLSIVYRAPTIADQVHLRLISHNMLY